MDPVRYERYHVVAGIGRDGSEPDFYKMCSTESQHCEEPRPAFTTVVLLEHGTYDGQPASKVLLIPRTGKFGIKLDSFYPTIGKYMRLILKHSS